jgi:hypothetical protein
VDLQASGLQKMLFIVKNTATNCQGILNLLAGKIAFGEQGTASIC